MHSPNSYYGSFKHIRKLKNILMIPNTLHLIFFFFCCKSCVILIPLPGIKLAHWKHRILTTGPPEKSLPSTYNSWSLRKCNKALEVKMKVSQSCLTLCNPMDYTVHGILQARILEWVA